MSHPNAYAAAIAGAFTIAVQWLIQRYAHAALSDYWKTAVTSGATVTVLYVGKHGLRAALGRVVNGPKTVWSGTAATGTAKK